MSCPPGVTAKKVSEHCQTTPGPLTEPGFGPLGQSATWPCPPAKTLPRLSSAVGRASQGREEGAQGPTWPPRFLLPGLRTQDTAGRDRRTRGKLRVSSFCLAGPQSSWDHIPPAHQPPAAPHRPLSLTLSPNLEVPLTHVASSPTAPLPTTVTSPDTPGPTLPPARPTPTCLPTPLSSPWKPLLKPLFPALAHSRFCHQAPGTLGLDPSPSPYHPLSVRLTNLPLYMESSRGQADLSHPLNALWLGRAGLRGAHGRPMGGRVRGQTVDRQAGGRTGAMVVASLSEGVIATPRHIASTPQEGPEVREMERQAQVMELARF